MKKQNNKDNSSPGVFSQEGFKIGIFVLIISILLVRIFFWLEGTFFNNKIIDVDTVTKKIIEEQKIRLLTLKKQLAELKGH